MNNYQLISTNTNLAGTVSLGYDIDKFKIGKKRVISMQNDYNKNVIYSDTKYSNILSNYYNIYKNDIYNLEINPLYKLNQSLPEIYLDSPLSNRIKSNEYGCERLKFNTFNKHYKIFAPLYIDDIDKIPNKIKVDITAFINNKKYNISPVYLDVDLKNMIDTKNIYDKHLFCSHDISKIMGWSLLDGNSNSIDTDLHKMLYAHDMTFYEWNKLICNEYKRHNLINQHLYNISFLFNLDDVIDEITLSNFDTSTRYNINLSYMYDNEILEFRDMNNNLSNLFVKNKENIFIDALEDLNEIELVEKTDSIIKRDISTFSLDYINDYIFNNYKSLSKFNSENYSNNFTYSSTDTIENIEPIFTDFLLYIKLNNIFNKPPLSTILINKSIINYSNKENTQGIVIFRGVKYYLSFSKSINNHPTNFALCYDTYNHAEYNLINDILILYTSTPTIKSFIDLGEKILNCPIIGIADDFDLTYFGEYPSRIKTNWYLTQYDKVERDSSFTLERYNGWIKPTLIDTNSEHSHLIYHKDIEWKSDELNINPLFENFEIKNFKSSIIYKLPMIIERTQSYDTDVNAVIEDIKINELNSIKNAIYNYTSELYKNTDTYKIILKIK